jgi:serine/threonine-protein kinase SRPK3
LRRLAAKHLDQPGYQHLMTMQDSFQISGPNGTHECLVLELLGPSVADLLDAHSGIERLPGTLAKTIAKQALFGLCVLHELKIAHAGIL